MDYQDDLHETFKMIHRKMRRKEVAKKALTGAWRLVIEIAVGVAIVLITSFILASGNK